MNSNQSGAKDCAVKSSKQKSEMKDLKKSEIEQRGFSLGVPTGETKENSVVSKLDEKQTNKVPFAFKSSQVLFQKRTMVGTDINSEIPEPIDSTSA